jgi:hypothetical protein
MEFRAFLDQMIHVPCQIIRHAHKVIYRPAELDRSDLCVLSTMRQPADPRKGRRHGNRSTKERQIKTSAATYSAEQSQQQNRQPKLTINTDSIVAASLKGGTARSRRELNH